MLENRKRAKEINALYPTLRVKEWKYITLLF